MEKKELTPEEKKMEKDYDKRLKRFIAGLKRLEEKHQIRAQMAYHTVYADLKLYELAEAKSDSERAKVNEQIRAEAEKQINKQQEGELTK